MCAYSFVLSSIGRGTHANHSNSCISSCTGICKLSGKAGEKESRLSAGPHFSRNKPDRLFHLEGIYVIFSLHGGWL
jgi:hypothetical protein